MANKPKYQGEIEKWEITDKKTTALLMDILVFADELTEFYNGRHLKRYFSIFFRGLAILTLVIGTICFMGNMHLPGKGVYSIFLYSAFLAISSILLLIDTAFGLSDGWIRYTTAFFNIKRIMSDYRCKFYKLSLENKEAEENKVKIEQVELLLQLNKDLHKVVSDETLLWGTNLKTAIANLVARVDKNALDMSKISTIEEIIKSRLLEEERKRQEQEKIELDRKKKQPKG